MNIIFEINGGIGKCIAATAVCEAIKKKYKKDNLIVISGYPEVFLNNPHVYQAYSFGPVYFYKNYIENKDFHVFLHDPYRHQDFLNPGKKQKHLIQIWCEMFDIPYRGEQPKLYFTKRETEFMSQRFRSDKPILALQSNGGAVGQPVQYSWARDLPFSIVNEVVDELKDVYNIMHIRREDQPGFINTIPVHGSFREMTVLLTMAQKRLLIDSFAQHACAAMDLPATVCWIANTPDIYGYPIHNNILANKFTKQPELRGSYLQPFNIIGDPVEFPYKSEKDIFDLDTILKSLE